MKAVPFAAFVALALSGCNEDVSTDDTDNGDKTTYEEVELFGNGQSQSFGPLEAPYDVEVTGNNNTLTFKADASIHEIDLTGNNNYLTFEEGAQLDKIKIFGSDNYIEHSESLSFSKDITGSGNTFSTFE